MSPISRREFVGAGIGAAAGLMIGFYLPHRGESRKDSFSPNAYLRITPDNKITIVVARSEMGQGVRTALPMILAEELEADWKQIEIEQAGASTLYGDQTTGGSASIRTTWDPMRKAGASAREMLISAAALTWGVSRSTCTAEAGHIKHAASNRSLSYGELAAKASTLPIPSDVPLKQSKDYKIVGQRLPRLDSLAKVKGEAVYGIDFRLPEMKYAVLARCPLIGGKATGLDDKESKKISGVTYVGRIGDSAVAVVADSVWSAMEGRRVLNVTWDEGPNKDLNSAAILASLKQAASKKGANLYAAGDPAKASGHHISAEYALPFMAHAPMEPGNCTAHYQGSKCELWAPTQVPQDCRDSVATAIGLDSDQVKVNVTLMGGGFGRRLEHDYAVEAAQVSKAINGPVKVIWTREDDMRCSTYRPASLHQLSATLDGSGLPVALTHRIISPSITGQKGQPVPNNVDPRSSRRGRSGLRYSKLCDRVRDDRNSGAAGLDALRLRAAGRLRAGKFYRRTRARSRQGPAQIPAATSGQRSGSCLLQHHVAHGSYARRAATGWRKSRVGQTASCRPSSRRRLLRMLPVLHGGGRRDHHGEGPTEGPSCCSCR
jgi:isoquinoline 1-oxidoreductase subunit beta